MIEAYNHGLDLSKQGRWKKSAEAFRDALKIRPEDGPSATYLKRCEEQLGGKKAAPAKAEAAPRTAAKPKAAPPSGTRSRISNPKAARRVRAREG